MAVNTDIWTGHNVYKTDIVYGDIISNMFNAGKIALNSTPDLSICPWGNKSIETGVFVYLNSAPALAGTITGDKIALGFGSYSTRGYAGNKIGFKNAYYSNNTNLARNSIFAWSPDQIKDTQGTLAPYITQAIYSFIYKKLIANVRIKCAKIIDENTLETKIATLYDYTHTFKTDYPYILNIAARINYAGSRDNTINICTSYAKWEFDGNILCFDSGSTVNNSGYGLLVYSANISNDNNYYFNMLGLNTANVGVDVVNMAANADYKATLYYNFRNMAFFAVVKHSDKIKTWHGFDENPEAQTHLRTPLFELTDDEIYKIVNNYGVIWSETDSLDINLNTTHVPIFSDGIVTDKWTSGAENLENPAYNWEDPYIDSGFDPDAPRDNNDYTDSIDLNTPNLNVLGCFNRSFALTYGNVESLSRFLWNADESIFDEIVSGLALMGGNPIDGIVDLRLYPFNVSDLTGGGTSTNIIIGRTNTGVTGIQITRYNAVIDMGSCSFFKKFRNFLDYEPFTTATLYIPYIGILPVSTAVFAGHNISCKMIVDLTTGSCTAVVYCDGIPAIYRNGVIGVDIPVTGSNSAEYASRIVSGLATGAASVVTGAATGNPSQILTGTGEIAESALSVNNTIYNTASAASPCCALWQPQHCYFIIERPEPIIPNNYGHSVGYACNFDALLSTQKGFTACYNADVNTIACTETEKDEITRLLAGGVYL